MVRRGIPKVVVAGSIVVALAVGGSGAVASPADRGTEEESRASNASTQVRRANESLDRISRLLAHAVVEKSLRRQIRGQIVERGTPDKAVTFESLSRSSDIRRALVRSFRADHLTSGRAARSAVDRLTASIPATQVSVPVKMGAWRASRVAPLVGYVPVGIDDMDLQTITAYDTAGKTHELDAWAEPDRPVIILGPDETAFHDAPAPGTSRASNSGQAPSASRGSCYGARLTYVRLVKDHEPWAKGMAEIFMTAKGEGVWFKDEFPYLEMDGDQIWPDQSLGCARGEVRFYWWEDDSSAFDFTLKLGSFSFGVNMADEDDLIGGRLLAWDTFRGTSEESTNFTDLIMKTM